MEKAPGQSPLPRKTYSGMYKILSFLHKLTGCLLCGLFFMWFASGIVMIYHSFPRASADKQLELQQTLPAELPPVEALTAALPDSAAVPALSLQMLLDEPVFRIGAREASLVSARSFEPVEETRETTIRTWCDAPVARIDTLYKLDQWIPFGRNREELPIYKYHFADPERHQLYLSSKSGRVLQFTSHKERVWAWFGAIPHWVYFTRLRQEQELWLNSVKWAAGIGCIMVILGFVLAIRVAVKSKKKVAPYKKRWYNWHYILGFVFGIFAITFAFSGMMSLADMPEFLKKAPRDKSEQAQPRGGRRGGPGRPDARLDLDRYTLDYRQALAAYPGTKTIAWSSYKGEPYYTLTLAPKQQVLVDARENSLVKPFVLTEEMVRREMQRQYGDSIPYTVEKIDKFDREYHFRKVTDDMLPVYRVIVDDYMHTRYYYNPATLAIRRIDDDTRTRNWLYHKLHTLDFKFLTDRPWLWNIVMYTLMIGGTALSVTGIVLSVRWLARGIRRLFRKKRHIQR